MTWHDCVAPQCVVFRGFVIIAHIKWIFFRVTGGVVKNVVGPYVPLIAAILILHSVTLPLLCMTLYIWRLDVGDMIAKLTRYPPIYFINSKRRAHNIFSSYVVRVVQSRGRGKIMCVKRLVVFGFFVESWDGILRSALFVLLFCPTPSDSHIYFTLLHITGCVSL